MREDVYVLRQRELLRDDTGGVVVTEDLIFFNAGVFLVAEVVHNTAAPGPVLGGTVRCHTVTVTHVTSG